MEKLIKLISLDNDLKEYFAGIDFNKREDIKKDVRKWLIGCGVNEEMEHKNYVLAQKLFMLANEMEKVR